MHFLGLGGPDEVGASAYLYLLQEGTLLIDAGLRPGQPMSSAFPQLDLLGEHPPKAVILTHAHLNHVGALPLVIRRFPKLPIYCSAATAHLAPLVLADSLKVSTAQGEPHFTAGELARTLGQLRPVRWHRRVTDHGFTFTLIPVGHLVGAASVLMETAGKTAFHTGDVGNVDTPVVTAAYLPKEVHPVDAVVTESMYGDTLLPSRKGQIRVLVEKIAAAVRAGGKVLIPAASVGPAQEITQLLLTAMEAGQICKVPISLDGQVRQVTAAYESMLDSLPPALRQRQELTGRPVFLHGPVRLVKDRDERARLINQDQPAIVIASGTTLTTGAARAYARAWLPDSGRPSRSTPASTRSRFPRTRTGAA